MRNAATASLSAAARAIANALTQLQPGGRLLGQAAGDVFQRRSRFPSGRVRRFRTSLRASASRR